LAQRLNDTLNKSKGTETKTETQTRPERTLSLRPLPSPTSRLKKLKLLWGIFGSGTAVIFGYIPKISKNVDNVKCE
jgi:hypothetical protein